MSTLAAIKADVDRGLVFAKEYGDQRNRADLIGQPLQANNLGERQFSRLIKAAGLSVLAHLEDLTTRGLVATEGQPSFEGR